MSATSVNEQESDEIVEEVRRIRHEYARQHDYDLDSIFEDLRNVDRGDREVVSFSPKPAIQRRSAA